MRQKFVKLTVENKKYFWNWLRRLLVIDPERSSGITYNNQYRKPAPGSPERLYARPLNLPASDISENSYWKRDMRRNYPRPGIITQPILAKLFVLGSVENPKISEPSETEAQTTTPAITQSLSTILYNAEPSEIRKFVLTDKGIAPHPGNSYHWTLDEKNGYPSTYSVRTFR
ncbi:hypothetical protein PNEG_02492 [Pneumocystis murina B123]|uniref:Uncharacterized protein n=1 Tax=Pneumocystis murina (strain B123) TaxID=1069680 RepID=M7P5J1_PNEMU|nr:hypothetical protein PNEG_02492 [Pneumocystis murina B123]EMR09150.1 hypothetical protein PNEG_02492 [Pneumocystis murina B123]